MALLADIFITHKPGGNRRELFEKSLKSFTDNTPRDMYRLHLVIDGATVAPLLKVVPDHTLIHTENLGLGPSINQALAHIGALNDYYDDGHVPDKSKVAPFICYCQDDLLYTPGWLERLSKMFMLLENQHRLGFASGIECVEHKVKKDLGGGMLLKDWIRAAQMFARREYWLSMFPIPRFDPETMRVRAKPDNGMGSGVDWHFIRNHEKSVCRSLKTCLVIPGLCQHMGYKESTWLQRELPESENDKRIIEEAK